MEQDTQSPFSIKNLANRNFSKHSDIGFAIAIAGILFVLLFPIPVIMVDFLLAVSITLAVMILMTTLFIEKPLDLSVFPTMLLVTAIMRLALNIASTRLILAKGHTGPSAAGHVIEAFGNFVMSGNIVIGLIVFAIITIINFIVITKGSGRIAEVAARFSLDAMPGKQMAIDADLSAGLINEAQAKERRKNLEDESTFYGSMDGANKFVRGDAIAGILITFINLIGGVIIGVIQQGMSFQSALHTYSLLTIGDGLVSQVPALVISLSAGLLVSKAGILGSADKAIFGQFSKFPQALIMAAIIIAMMSFMPGIPAFHFLFVAFITFILGMVAKEIDKQKKLDIKTAEDNIISENENSSSDDNSERMSSILHIDTIILELGYSLLFLAQDNNKSKLSDQIKSLRKQIAEELGFILPSVRIVDNLQLDTEIYTIKIKNIECGRGKILPNMYLVMNPNSKIIDVPGIETTEPTFGLPAKWVSEEIKEEANYKNYTVIEPATVIITHITEIVKDNITELFSYAETQKLIDELPEKHKKLISDTIPDKITISGLQRVLLNLLSESVSIRDLPLILEAISEAVNMTKNIQNISEIVRTRLARQITYSNINHENILQVINVGPSWEKEIMSAIIDNGSENYQLALEPSKIQAFIQAVRDKFEQISTDGSLPVIVTSSNIRIYVKAIINKLSPGAVVMAQSEIYSKVKIRSLGQIN
jgi:flagellar biosynthesis protein FlhA